MIATGVQSSTSTRPSTVDSAAARDEGTPVWVPIVIVIVLLLCIGGAIAGFLFYRRRAKEAAESNGEDGSGTKGAADMEMSSARNDDTPTVAVVPKNRKKDDEAKLKKKWLNLQAESNAAKSLHVDASQRDARVSASAYLGTGRDFSEDDEDADKKEGGTQTQVVRDQYKLIPKKKGQQSAASSGYMSTKDVLSAAVVYDSAVLTDKNKNSKLDVEEFT
jgi:hypothetical protein